MNSAKRAVVLFDIDGTLIRRAGPQHRQALEMAVREVSGLETTTEGIPTQGMLDRDILRQMMRTAGAPDDAIDGFMPEIVRSAQELYRDLCPDLTGRTCPGSLEILQRLYEAGIPAGLVTGNFTNIAWRKMEAAGLRPYLQFGAFAEMGSTRAELAKLAVSQAADRGWIDSETTISLVGDHPNDIAAARANDLRAIGVCTGVVLREELAAANPDKLFENLTFVDIKDFM